MLQKSRWLPIALSLCVLAPLARAVEAPRLKVSDNHRFLVKSDGSPFFYLGDTAWELFHRVKREDVDLYLTDRAAKGFTVIQAVGLAEFNGLTEPNPYGQLPLADNDPTKPNDKYFEHVDYVVDKAGSLGMFVGFLPTWGDKVNKKWGKGPEIFTPENAAAFGEYLGKRYKDKSIIWILGGDRPIEKPEHLEIWRAMAAGLTNGDGGSHLITYHPVGGHSSSEWVHNEPWLDFDMLQSGHGRRDLANDEMIAADYARKPPKPVLDGELRYEDHPINWKPQYGWFDAHDVRKAIYWSLFAGATGATYGCHDVWQFLDKERHPPVSSARTPWKEALQLPGAAQAGLARKLIESKPFITRIPDQSIIIGDAGKGADHAQATRDSEGAYLMVYIPSGKPVTVDMKKLRSKPVHGSWFDPRTGASKPIGYAMGNGAPDEFKPPATEKEPDWVLVLEAK
jgi:hypothetical protein